MSRFAADSNSPRCPSSFAALIQGSLPASAMSVAQDFYRALDAALESVTILCRTSYAHEQQTFPSQF